MEKEVVVEIHRYILEQEHDFPCLVLSGSQPKNPKNPKNQNQKQILLRFFPFLNLHKTLQTKEEREEVD